MPTYEYRCPNGHEFEKFQRMSEPPVAQCPGCGKEAQRMLSGGAGLLFKGEGFYITDYRSDSYKKAAESEKPAAAGSDSTADTKPAGGSRAKPPTGKPDSSGGGASKASE
jgi:putative FmdB family regulatory protein